MERTMDTKSVLGVLEGILGIPEGSRKNAIRFMRMTKPEVAKSIIEPILKCAELMSEMSEEDRVEVLDWADRQCPSEAKTEVPAKPEPPEAKPDPVATEPELRNIIPARRTMMDKARKLIGGLPTGSKVTPISICKRAGIDPANMYQLCRSLVQEGLLEKVSFAKYKVKHVGETTMKLAEQVASMKPKRSYHRRENIIPSMSPKAYIESMPKNKVFKLKKVKQATGKQWNSVTATAWQLAHEGVIKRKARGVYVRV